MKLFKGHPGEHFTTICPLKGCPRSHLDTPNAASDKSRCYLEILPQPCIVGSPVLCHSLISKNQAVSALSFSSLVFYTANKCCGVKVAWHVTQQYWPIVWHIDDVKGNNFSKKKKKTFKQQWQVNWLLCFSSHANFKNQGCSLVMMCNMVQIMTNSCKQHVCTLRTLLERKLKRNREWI